MLQFLQKVGLFVIFLTPSLTRSCEPPKVSLFLDWDESNQTGQSQLQFVALRKSLSSIQFLLHCQHHTPIRWIINEDYIKGEEPGSSATNRSFTNFHNPETYTYTAKYFLQPTNPIEDVVYICQSFHPVCERTVVLAHVESTFRNSKTKNFTVRVLPQSEVDKGVAALKSLDAQLAKLEGMNAITASDRNGSSCPFELSLHVWRHNFDIAFAWDPPNGTANTFNMPNAQSLANADLLYPLLEEKCIKYVVDPVEFQNCTNCGQKGYQVHQFFPQMLTYALGSERGAMKGFFDLQPRDLKSFWYVWESVDPQLGILAIQSPPTVYKGQPFTVKCFPSVFFYSHGTLVAWSFKNLTNDMKEGFASDILEKEEPVNGGVYQVVATLSFHRQFLVDHKLDSVQVDCVCPLWNSTEWVNKTLIVHFQDSELPQITSGLNNSSDILLHQLLGTKDEFLLTCDATGVPLPTLEFIPPKNNLYFETEVNTTNDMVTISLRFPNISRAHEGIYLCVATSVVGEARKSFEIKLAKEPLPPFLLIIVASGAVVILIFVGLTSALLYKLRKEKVEFLRRTEEAIKKFREGFHNTQDLGFKPNEEYKSYEIPIARWGIGNTLLGSGAFGMVQKGVIYYGDNRQDTVAVKTVNSPKEIVDFENSLMELTIMSYIGKHEHVVSLVGACTDNIGKRSILIGVEYCANGDLLNYVQKRRAIFRSFVSAEGVLSLDSITGRSSYVNVANSGNFTSLDLYKWAYHIASGMDFLASKKILHADLAARNVLLTSDNIAKISDFGLSRQLIMSDNYTKKTNQPLPWRWMAIESLKFRKFSTATDVWSYGVTLFEIFTLGEEPWPGMNWTTEFMEELERGRRLNKPKFATNNMYEKVMLECWRNEPNERITFATARAFFETAITNLTAPEGKEDDFLNNVC